MGAVDVVCKLHLAFGAKMKSKREYLGVSLDCQMITIWSQPVLGYKRILLMVAITRFRDNVIYRVPHLDVQWSLLYDHVVIFAFDLTF